MAGFFQQVKAVVDDLPEEAKDGMKSMAAKTTAGFGVWGITLETWIAILTALYFLLQIGLLLIRYWEEVPKFIDTIQAWRESRAHKGDDDGQQ